MLFRLLAYCAIVGVVFGATKYNALKYSYADFKAYLDLLMNVSGMVFTLMGIWIAVLYPNALSRLLDPEKVLIADFSESLSETRRLENIVASVLQSGIVVVATLSISLARLLISGTSVYSSYLQDLQALALAAVVVMTILQAEAIFRVISANVQFLHDLHRRREQRETDNDI